MQTLFEGLSEGVWIHINNTSAVNRYYSGKIMAVVLFVGTFTFYFTEVRSK